MLQSQRRGQAACAAPRPAAPARSVTGNPHHALEGQRFWNAAAYRLLRILWRGGSSIQRLSLSCPRDVDLGEHPHSGGVGATVVPQAPCRDWTERDGQAAVVLGARWGKATAGFCRNCAMLRSLLNQTSSFHRSFFPIFSPCNTPR